MENHPIPQDVTGFQFKLIGNMTVKQFAYVAFGVVFAVVLYYFPIHSPLSALIKIILIPIVGGCGFAIAFIPVEGRPIDIMVGNFIKALFFPNQYVYQKSGRLLSFASISSPKVTPVTHVHAPQHASINKSQQLQSMLGAPAHVQNKLDQREAAFLQTISSPSSFSNPSTPPPMKTEPVKPEEQTAPVQKTTQTADTLTHQETVLTQQLAEAKKEEATVQTPATASAAHQKAVQLEQQIQAVHAQKQHLEQELQQLQKQLAGQQAKPVVKAPAPAQMVTKGADLPNVPDTPNVIVGIVKDPRGNVLPNILVEVKDKDGNPVRAFKTNPLGQFASATPLASGSYTVELEDPKGQNTFQVIQLVADNRILLPIEIVSHDSREELRKQLFN